MPEKNVNISELICLKNEKISKKEFRAYFSIKPCKKFHYPVDADF